MVAMRVIEEGVRTTPSMVAFADDGEGWLVNPPNDKL